MAGTLRSIEILSLESSGTLIDTLAPFLLNRDPASGQTGVNETANILFRIDDDEVGVDLTTVVITIDGNLAYDGGAGGFQAGFTGTVTAIGPLAYDFDINPNVDLSPNSNVPVRVEAQDDAGNALDETYTFNTPFRILGQFKLRLRAVQRGAAEGVSGQEAVKFS
jgi:hypothetical protein